MKMIWKMSPIYMTLLSADVCNNCEQMNLKDFSFMKDDE